MLADPSPWQDSMGKAHEINKIKQVGICSLWHIPQGGSSPSVSRSNGI